MTKSVLQKLLADAGIASRRQAEKLIVGGSVTINGKRAKLGDRASADEDDVRVNGKPLSFTKQKIYIKLHKPVGIVCTTRSFPGEHNVFELVKTTKPLTIVGRLDKDSEGLVLLTDDGDLAYKMTHPKFGVDKVYRVTLGHDMAKTKPEEKKKITELIAAFKKGVNIGAGDGTVKAERIKHLHGRSFEVVLREGKKRQIRRMFRQLDCHVSRLVRVRIGSVTIGGIKRGEWKHLTGEEIEKLKLLPTYAKAAASK